MTTFSDAVYQHGGVPVGGLESFAVGNVYFVCETSNSLYSTDFIKSKTGKYEDYSERVHNTAQSALNACVAYRNDYVIVLDNLSISSALSMATNRQHLICPTGIKPNFPGDFSITQSGSADVITITGNGCEVAGFWLINKLGQDAIDIRTTWMTHIHHNYFALKATASSDSYGIVGTSPIQFNIHHNLFNNAYPGAMSGTDNDIAAFIGITSGASTRGMIADNIMHTGANTTVAAGITTGGYGQFILRNYLWENPSHGGSDAGTFTVGISGGANCLIADNRVGLGTAANGVSGGTANQSYVENYEGTSGGTVLT